MYITTHITIVNICYKYFNKKNNINLNKNNLFWGAIQPDFQKGKNKIKHTYSVSHNKIIELEHEIMNNNLEIYDYSKKIGNISHFIVDSFCKYHLEDYYGKNMIKHFAYEFLLDLKLMHIILFDRDIIDAILFDVEFLEESSFKYLSDNRDKYLSLNEHILNDLYYAIKTTGYLIHRTSKITSNDCMNRY